MNTNTRLFLGLLTALLFLPLFGCTKYNLVEVEEPALRHETTMWKYFESDAYNWSLTMKLIEKAGLKDLFEGKSRYGQQITFFGITNTSIKRYVLEKKEQDPDTPFSIDDITSEQCRDIILSCVVPEKARLLDDWKSGYASSDVDKIIGTGGEMVTMANGKVLWIYTYRAPYNGVKEMGPKQIHLVSEETGKGFVIASHNITTLTGVVHSLDPNFTS